MKTCPTCRRPFPDDGPSFCPDDGARLSVDAPAFNQPPPNYYHPGGGQPPPQQYAPQAFAPQAGRRKGLAVAALILGVITLILWAFSKLLGLGANVISLALFLPLSLLPLLLGAVALFLSLRKPGVYGGKIPASLGAVCGLLVAGLTLTLFAFNVFNSTRQIRYAGTQAGNRPLPAERMGATNPAGSTAALSDEEKYRLFYAAGQTKDPALMLRVSKKIGIVDASGSPTSSYPGFVGGSVSWAMRDTAFTKQLSTPEKAREYVNSRL